MGGRTGNQVDWSAFLGSPAFSYLLLTLVVVLAGLAYMFLTS
jgi:hypothetical protein